MSLTNKYMYYSIVTRYDRLIVIVLHNIVAAVSVQSYLLLHYRDISIHNTTSRLYYMVLDGTK